MRYVRSDSFKADYRCLPVEQRALFREAVRLFNDAADRMVATGDTTSWPASLRVKSVEGTRGVFRMTWSFSGPDGRATWEWVQVADPETGRPRPAIRWRRIGTHEVLTNP